jgi:hypothetical protein
MSSLYLSIYLFIINKKQRVEVLHLTFGSEGNKTFVRTVVLCSELIVFIHISLCVV